MVKPCGNLCVHFAISNIVHPCRHPNVSCDEIFVRHVYVMHKNSCGMSDETAFFVSAVRIQCIGVGIRMIHTTLILVCFARHVFFGFFKKNVFVFLCSLFFLSVFFVFDLSLFFLVLYTD